MQPKELDAGAAHVHLQHVGRDRQGDGVLPVHVVAPAADSAVDDADSAGAAAAAVLRAALPARHRGRDAGVHLQRRARHHQRPRGQPADDPGAGQGARHTQGGHRQHDDRLLQRRPHRRLAHRLRVRLDARGAHFEPLPQLPVYSAVAVDDEHDDGGHRDDGEDYSGHRPAGADDAGRPNHQNREHRVDAGNADDRIRRLHLHRRRDGRHHRRAQRAHRRCHVRGDARPGHTRHHNYLNACELYRF